MTKSTNHFIGNIKPISKWVVKDYGVVVRVIIEGTVKWKVEDNYSQIHSIIIHNVNYVCEAAIFLLSSQKWVKETSYKNSKYDGTWCTTKSKLCIVYCNQ